jgi:undecaprenyl diphosphate synthase
VRIIEASELDYSESHIPPHTAIIMDGNGRWASMRGMPREAGHTAGADAIMSVVEGSARCQQQQLTLFAFAETNWMRPEAELLRILYAPRWMQKQVLPMCLERNVRLTFLGETKDPRLPTKIRNAIAACEDATQHNTGLGLCVVFNYKDEHPKTVDESQLPVDLLIRTGSEQRLSGFPSHLLRNAELVFTDTLWPDFRHWHLLSASAEFNSRRRRFGRANS